MYKRVCPSCGVPSMVLSQAKADRTWPCHHCGTELGPELNQQIGEMPIPAAPAEKPHFPQVGNIVVNGCSILANYKNQYVLAKGPTPDSPSAYIVWDLDQNGDPYGGSYFLDATRAEMEFVERCFPHLKIADVTITPIKCEPVAGVVIDVARIGRDLNHLLEERQHD